MDVMGNIETQLRLKKITPQDYDKKKQYFNKQLKQLKELL